MQFQMLVAWVKLVIGPGVTLPGCQAQQFARFTLSFRNVSIDGTMPWNFSFAVLCDRRYSLLAFALVDAICLLPEFGSDLLVIRRRAAEPLEMRIGVIKLWFNIGYELCQTSFVPLD